MEPVNHVQAFTCRSELSSLRCQLHEAEDRESERNVEIARLKADLNHWKNRATKLTKELQTSEDALKKSHNQIQVYLGNIDFSSRIFLYWLLT